MTAWSDPRGRFEPPPDCRRILIVGAGGFGREALQWALDAWPGHADLIAGFLAANPVCAGPPSHRKLVLGDPSEFEPCDGDYFVMAIGIPGVRRRVADTLARRGGRFLTLAHPSAVIAATAVVGRGSVICPFAIVSDTARLGECVLVNYHASVGHDGCVGDFAVLSPYATLGGHARTGEDVFLGLHASIGPGRTVGARSKVSANSCCLADAPPDSIIYGDPGRIAGRVAIAADATDARS